MLSLLQEKMRVLWWNFLFILLGVLLIGILHAYISQLVNFCVHEVSLMEEVGSEKEFQKRGATKITKSGRVITQAYELGSSALYKQEEAHSNALIIFLLAILLPFLLIVAYTLFTQASLLAVNRNVCLAIISLFAISGIFYVELLHFMEDGNGAGFLFSALPSVQLTFFYSFFVSMQPKELTSPYYRSKTELVIDEVNMAA